MASGRAGVNMPRSVDLVWFSRGGVYMHLCTFQAYWFSRKSLMEHGTVKATPTVTSGGLQELL